MGISQTPLPCAWRIVSHPVSAYPNGMANIPLTLAALATSAVPGLTAVAVRPHDALGDEYNSVILTTEDDEIIVSVPKTQQAETAQSASLLALTALSDGARDQLPFEVPRVLGMTRAGDTRAVATSFLDGARFDIADLTDDAILIESIARSIASIHALPHSIVQQGGLSNRSATDQRLLVTRLVDRAAATRSLPETVQRRWVEVLETASLWDFSPKTVHGSLKDSSILVADDAIIGVLDWSQFAVADPAVDLAWLLEAGDAVFEAVLGRYLKFSDASDAQALRSRAMLYHELEVAKWLLHGVETHDRGVIDDAVAMLDRMVDRLSLLEPAIPSRSQLSEAEVETLLDQTPDVNDRLSDTAAYEALDEDRMFGIDTDFVDPLPKPETISDADADASGEAGADPASRKHPEGQSSGDEQPESDEQLTQPIDDEDLPPKAR